MKLRLNLPLETIVSSYKLHVKTMTGGLGALKDLAFPSFECKDYDSLFVNPWIKYDTRIE
jgi:hypothetical protein